MTKESPFTLRRFETENRHLYYLPTDLFMKLVGRRSTYLIGSRGTGKTTLLKALHWEEQQNNAYLRERLSALGVTGNYLGIYMRMPRTMADVFDGWIPSATEHFRAAVFCLYLDLMWVQSACEAIAHLLLTDTFNSPSSAEYGITRELLERFPELRERGPVQGSITIKGFGSLLYQKRRTLERWIYSGIDRKEDEIMEAFPVAQIGEFGQETATALAAFCDHASMRNKDWHFKICFDESECFSPAQQRAINTSVRNAQSPLSFAVSYVRLVDVTSTLIRGISLQDADREVIPLDAMTDSEFTDLAEGVATVRIQRLSPGYPEFSTRTAFGILDINELLVGILNASANAEAKRLLTAAETLAKTPFFIETSDRPSGSLPIYQAYILDRLNLTLPAPQSPSWERRKQDSAEIRKRMVAAYLCICKELKTQARYGGAEMILQMSDSCIRDYLSQLDSVFQLLDADTGDFGTKRIPLFEQDVAITQASKRKNETIPKSEIGSPVETLRLIDSLGQLTARLQTSIKDMKSLKTPERGLFTLPIDTSTSESAETLRLITEAADAGFLKILTSDSRSVRFRIHCSLAGAYGVSYRGAYYECGLKHSDLRPLYAEPDEDVRANKVMQLADLLLGDETSLPLFEGIQ